MILLILCVLSSCVHKVEDRELLADTFQAPAAYTSLKGPPRVKKWADFHAYPKANVELSYLVNWDGDSAIAGDSMAIHLSEGSRIENTTAHPQYFEIWMQIPDPLHPGQPYPIRPAAKHRPITRTRQWGSEPGDITRYSVMCDGEMTLTGMQGYDVPTLAKSRRPVAMLTVTHRSPRIIRFTLQGSLPVFEDTGHGGRRYDLKIDRTYTALINPPKTK